MSRYIDADETLKAMDTWDKFGVLPNGTVIPFRNCENADDYVPYVKYEDMVNCVKNMPKADVVEVIHGSWVVDEDSAYIDAHCSECGMQMRYNKLQQFDCFCKRCGAKMDGER